MAVFPRRRLDVAAMQNRSFQLGSWKDKSHEIGYACIGRITTLSSPPASGLKGAATADKFSAEINQRASLVCKHRDGIVFKDGKSGTTFVSYQMIQVSCHVFQTAGFYFFHCS